VQPLETTVFPASQVVDAFKFNASCSNNLGRTVIEIREEEDKVNAVPAKITVAASPKLFYSPEKTFVVSGEFSTVLIGVMFSKVGGKQLFHLTHFPLSFLSL